MTNKLKWRLGKLPTPDEVLKLVNDKLITKEEAREILFNEETENERDIKSLEEEIIFLRNLVEKMSGSRPALEVIKVIEEYIPLYYQKKWYRPYEVWCSNTTSATVSTNDVTSYNGQTYVTNGTSISNFSNIQTF